MSYATRSQLLYVKSLGGHKDTAIIGEDANVVHVNQLRRAVDLYLPITLGVGNIKESNDYKAATRKVVNHRLAYQEHHQPSSQDGNTDPVNFQQALDI